MRRLTTTDATWQSSNIIPRSALCHLRFCLLSRPKFICKLKLTCQSVSEAHASTITIVVVPFVLVHVKTLRLAWRQRPQTSAMSGTVADPCMHLVARPGSQIMQSISVTWTSGDSQSSSFDVPDAIVASRHCCVADMNSNTRERTRVSVTR